MTIREVLAACKTALESYYGDQFKGLVVYGSMARGQAEVSSDIDLLVLLSPPFDYFLELRQVIDVLYPVQLESEQPISARPVRPDEFEQGTIQLYRNAKREGKVVGGRELSKKSDFITANWRWQRIDPIPVR